MPTLTAKQNGNYKVNGYNTLHVNVQPGGGGGGTAASISYDNTISALTATNVQAAIDELASDISSISVPDPSSTTPLMDGVATVGSEVRFARGDHRHPSDTSRVPTSRTINGYALTSNITLSASDVGALADSTVVPTPSSTTPLMDGTASVGSETAYARGDHVHPSEMEEFTNAEIDTITSTATTPWNPDFTEAAEWIVEQYTGTSLYGSSQTIEDAFTAVNDDLTISEHMSILSHLTAGTGNTIIEARASYNDFFCTVRVRCKRTDEAAFATGRTQTNPLFTFDSTFRPSTPMIFPVVTNNTIGGVMSSTADCYISQGGNCIVDVPSGNTTAKEIQICCTYAR